MNRLVLLVALCACREQAEIAPSIEVAHYAALPSNKLDVLFQIDNSVSVSHWQASLAVAFPTLSEAIDDLDLHIGVITSDLGTTASDGSPAAGDCFEIVEDAAVCGDRPRLAVHLAAPLADEYVRVRCKVATE